MEWIEWRLRHLYNGKAEAKEMTRNRKAYHQDLYDNIRIPMHNIDPMEYRPTASVEIQAIKIAEAKNRYERKIAAANNRYKRLYDVLGRVNDGVREKAINLLENGQSLPISLLKQLKDVVTEDEQAEEEERNKEAMEIFRKISREERGEVQKRTREVIRIMWNDKPNMKGGVNDESSSKTKRPTRITSDRRKSNSSRKRECHSVK